jgi:thioredoxin-related protein
MIKRLSFCLLIVLLSTVLVQAQPGIPTAGSILDNARERAANEHKKVFLIFHASWCGWCHRMDTLMNNTACRKLFEGNYIVAHMVVMESDGKKNLENAGGEEMLKKYNGEGQGIPFWVILDEKGHLLADCQLRHEGADLSTRGKNTGCPATKEEVAHFIKVLQQTSSLTTEQLSIIEKNFLKKEGI